MYISTINICSLALSYDDLSAGLGTFCGRDSPSSGPLELPSWRLTCVVPEVLLLSQVIYVWEDGTWLMTCLLF